MSPTTFAMGLEGLGVRCEVEARGKLAVIMPVEPMHLGASVRREIVALGRRYGFANVCIELREPDGALSGD